MIQSWHYGSTRGNEASLMTRSNLLSVVGAIALWYGFLIYARKDKRKPTQEIPWNHNADWRKVGNVFL